MADTILAQFAGALIAGKIKVIDLTQPLEPTTPIIQLPPQFAATWPFRLEEISNYDDRGPAWYWSNFACGEHTGTHFDAPIHWVTGKDYPHNATDFDPGREIHRARQCGRLLEGSGRQSRFPAHP